MWRCYRGVKSGEDHEWFDRLMVYHRGWDREGKSALNEIRKCQAIRRELEEKYGTADELSTVTRYSSTVPTSATELKDDVQVAAPTRTDDEVIAGLSVEEYLSYMEERKKGLKWPQQGNREEESLLLGGNAREESSPLGYADELASQPVGAAATAVEPPVADAEETGTETIEDAAETVVEPLEANDDAGAPATEDADNNIADPLLL